MRQRQTLPNQGISMLSLPVCKPLHVWGSQKHCCATAHHVPTLYLCQLPEPGAVRPYERLAPCEAGQVGSSESSGALAGPGPVQLWFDERLEARFCQLSVWNAAGQQVARGDIQVDPADSKKLSVGLPALPTGISTVKYRVLSVDSHIVENQFIFIVWGSP